MKIALLAGVLLCCAAARADDATPVKYDPASFAAQQVAEMQKARGAALVKTAEAAAIFVGQEMHQSILEYEGKLVRDNTLSREDQDRALEVEKTRRAWMPVPPEIARGRDIAGARMVDGWRDVATDPAEADKLLGADLFTYYMNQGQARTAADLAHITADEAVRLSTLRAFQNERLIEQNDQIIKLLKQLANR